MISCTSSSADTAASPTVFSRASLIHRLPRSARRDSLDTQRAFRPFGTDDQQGLSANPSGQLSGLVLHYPGVGNQLPLKQRIRLGEVTDSSRAVADCGRRLDDRLRTASGAYLCPRWARQRGIGVSALERATTRAPSAAMGLRQPRRMPTQATSWSALYGAGAAVRVHGREDGCMDRWIDHAVWWQVYPLGFVGAEPRALHRRRRRPHRLRRMRAWLDYLVDLGCNGLALGPVFASETHGYDTVDHLRIDPRLGDDADVRRAGRRPAAAAASGCCSTACSTTSGGTSRGSQEAEARAGLRRRAVVHIAGTRRATVSATVFEGHDAARRAQPRRARGRDYVASVMAHWLDRGVDGWRLDAAYAVPPRSGAACCPGCGNAIPRRVVRRRGDPRRLPGVRRASPGWTRSPSTSCGSRSGARSTTRNLFELAWTLERHDELLASFTAAHLRRQPRRHPDRQQADRHPATSATRWPCCSPCRRVPSSTTATSRRSPA